MPEYLAPGVYVEEVSYRPKSIQGVGTSTTAFVGPTRRGPLGVTPEVVTSFGEFSRIYGGLADLQVVQSFTDGAAVTAARTNYLAHAVRHFFDNGGTRLYVARAFVPHTEGVDADGDPVVTTSGVARSADLIADAGVEARFTARMPGSGLNGQVNIYEKRTPATTVTMASAPVGSLLAAEAGGTTTFFRKTAAGWVDASDTAFSDSGQTLSLVTMNVETVDGDGNSLLFEGVGYDAAHPRYLGAVLPEQPARLADALQNPYFFDVVSGTPTAFLLQTAFAPAAAAPLDPRVFQVTGGNDGVEPPLAFDADGGFNVEDALELLEDITDIAIIAAPGHSSFGAVNYRAIQGALISHAERMRYRIAVLDTPPGQLPGEARTTKSFVDSKYAALYYPWVMIANPLARPGDESIPREIAMPPSGFMCGIYARSDIERGVWKAPANEVVRGALRFEREVNHRVQETLNPEGINCLRYFPGRGNRVWGARTTSSDPEWMYVNIRRYFIYLEHSIDRSTQWAVFEPNGERLWANIRQTVESFLYAEWRSGALLGTTPEEAYFVRCDRSTMTQSDLDNGRLICEIGVAAVKPAEFVIFRIGQKTADARD